MILMRSNIPPNFNPVAIGAPQFGETRLQIARTPKHHRETTENSSTSERKLLRRGDGKLLTRGRRCSSAKVQLGNPG